MVSHIDTEGFQDSRYFVRSWSLLTRDPGWLWLIFVLWLAGFVPIAGPLGVQGYIAERARATAWGVPPESRQGGAGIGTYIKSGWRAFAVSFIWMLVWALVAPVSVLIPFIGPLLVLLGTIALGVLVRIAVLRATIYQSFTGGLRPGVVFQMADRDTVGLIRIFCIQLVGGALISAVAAITFTVVTGTTVLDIFLALAALIGPVFDSDFYSSGQFLVWFLMIARGVLVSIAVSSFLSSALTIITEIALGLWMRQFNVPAWGGNDDPLPATAPYAQAAPYNPPPSSYGDPGRAPYACGDTDYGQAGSSQPPTTPR